MSFDTRNIFSGSDWNSSLNLERYLYFNIDFLRYVGLLPFLAEEGACRNIKRTFNLMYSIFFVAWPASMFVMGAIDLVLHIQDLDKIAFNAVITLYNVICLTKLFYFNFRRQHYLSLFRLWDDCVQSEAFKAARQKSIEESMKHAKNVTLLLYLVFVVMSLQWLLFPLATFDYSTPAFVNGTALRRNWSFPIALWYPYDTQSSPAFEITYVLLIGLSEISISMNSAYDTFFIALIIHGLGQFKHIQDSLKEIMLSFPNVNARAGSLPAKGTYEYIGSNSSQILLDSAYINEGSSEELLSPTAAIQKSEYLEAQTKSIFELERKRLANVSSRGFNEEELLNAVTYCAKNHQVLMRYVFSLT